jgi:hypothetical protein
MIAFIQACNLDSNEHGGSSKIFRALLDTDHPPVLSINTHFSATPVGAGRAEIQIPSRPDFGRLEHTRLSGSLGVFDSLFSRRFEARLRRALVDHQIRIIHLLATTYSLVPVYNVATDLGIPYFISIHDDLEYVSKNHLLMGQMRKFIGKSWRGARGAFVISEEIGNEYSRRYGAREFVVVTDGLKYVADAPQQRPKKNLRLYFMGLFHIAYAQNLRAVLDALKIVRSQRPDWDILVTCRCGSISAPLREDDVPVLVLPFAPEAVVEKDMESADLLYQPLPFQEQARAFSKFSMSTKMITYLGSGLPIFYHGPEDAAAGKLLAQNDAAAICTTLDPEGVARQLLEAFARRESIVQNALALARAQFMLADQQRRFWQPICQALQ